MPPLRLSYFARLFRWHRPGGPTDIDWEGDLKDAGALPVWADWVGGFGLLPDGQVVFLPHKSSAPPDAVLEPHLRHVTYLAASRRYPEFASLAPRRRADDPTCPSCGGTGHATMPDGTPAPATVVCFCGGAGWLPAGFDHPGRIVS